MQTGATIPRLMVVAVVYFLAAQLGLLLAFHGTNISPVWPPTGIAFAAVFLYGYRIWPAIALSAFFANIINLPVYTSAGIAIGNTLEAIAGVYLLRLFPVSKRLLESSRDVSLFLLLPGLTSTIISATIGTIAVFFSGLHHGASFGYLWYTWWLGDSVGNLTVAPLVLAWSNIRKSRWNRKRVVEALFVAVTLVFIGYTVLGTSFSMGISLAYLALPLILISAFRFQQLGAVTSVFLLSTIATWGTIHSRGPFQTNTLNGSLLFLEMFMGIITATGLLVAALITESKKSQQELRGSLNEKELLLREIHHRVKNNLQIISSLLSLQSRTTNDAAAIKVFQESGTRIKAMALIHEKLYGTDNLSTIQFTEYANDLAEELFRVYGMQLGTIHLKVEAGDTLLDINQAIPLGLVMNELISNCCKYAFPDGRSGNVVVALRAGNPMEFSVQDDGVGIPGGIQIDEAQSLGLRLVRILAGQLQGNVTLETGPAGTRVCLKFPPVAPESSSFRKESY